MGTHRGGIDEHWLASTTPADNGPDTSRDEGLSQVVVGGQRVRWSLVAGCWLLAAGCWSLASARAANP